MHDIQAKTTYPIIPPTNPSKTAYAAWSPTGSAIAYVIDNDVYILPDASYAFNVCHDNGLTSFVDRILNLYV